jgi:uncharacterized protein DUF3224
MTTATMTLTVQGWDEDTYEERDGGGKLTLADVTQGVTGDGEGTAKARWIMAYTAADRAEYVGLQTVTGSLAGRSGSFVLRTTGTFDGSKAVGDLTVVEGSGTGELAGISGTGSFSAPMGSEAELTLEYELG